MKDIFCTYLTSTTASLKVAERNGNAYQVQSAYVKFHFLNLRVHIRLAIST
jgi:hypothetical protein